MNIYFVAGLALWAGLIFVVFNIRPNAKIHEICVGIRERKNTVIIFIVMIIIILLCILPMGLSPIWNGEIPGHRDQYEILADSILDGHLYLDNNDIDPVLLEMDDPYNPQERKRLQVDFKWDYVFYNGHYYMYFGVVPVFLLFLPYRIITGTRLTTYHATQIFVALFICGVFAVFNMIAKRYFKKMSMGVFLMLASAFSIMSVWYSATAPALYCTAISAAICMEIWSLFFFIRAVWMEEEQRKTIIFAFCGSVFGALAFGCRPPVALANLLVVPMLIEYLRKRKINFKLILQLLLAALPYIIVGILLMVYNYMRFGSPFEFGLKYQLTVANMGNYGGILNNSGYTDILDWITYDFLDVNFPRDSFPYVSFSGVMINFPILWISAIGLASKTVRKSLKENRLLFFVLTLTIIPVIISVVDGAFTPVMMERYRMDIYWILGLLCFIVIGFYYMSISEKKIKFFNFCISLFAFGTILVCVLLFLVPNDGNLTKYYPEVLEEILRVIKLDMYISWATI